MLGKLSNLNLEGISATLANPFAIKIITLSLEKPNLKDAFITSLSH
jgi:hypothetical protein